MNKIKLTADSTVDLSKKLIEECGVEIVPLHIIMEDKEYRDGIDITAADMLDKCERTGKLAKTAAVSIGEYTEVFERWVKEGYEVIHVDISSEMSTCNQSANIAAQQIGNVHVVDSRNLSTGSGHLVMLAKLLIDQGELSAAQIAQKLRDTTPLVEASFILDTLEYLHKGGRCSAVAALGANLLRLHPCIKVKNGVMGVGKKYRGTMAGATYQYVLDQIKGRDDLDTRLAFITHSAHCEQEIIDAAVSAVEKVGVFDRVEITSAGCTICSHCGYNCIGVLFLHKEQ